MAYFSFFFRFAHDLWKVLSRGGIIDDLVLFVFLWKIFFLQIVNNFLSIAPADKEIQNQEHQKSSQTTKKDQDQDHQYLTLSYAVQQKYNIGSFMHIYVQ